jgi:hypothetical protein
MSEYGTITHQGIVGTFDGDFRVITETHEGDLHDFHVPFSVAHGPDSFYVNFDFENVRHEYGPENDQTMEFIQCPNEIEQAARKKQGDILRKANV